MNRRHILIHRKLKTECVEDYISWHQKVPSELMEVYRQSGILNVVCFVEENDLIVFIEVDDDVYKEKSKDLAQNAVEINWQTLMASLNDPDFTPRNFREVFRM